MSSCEKCWAESRSLDNYLDLLYSRNEHPCTPEQQAGEYAHQCPYCQRYTLHQYTKEPMCGCPPLYTPTPEQEER